MPYVLPEPMVWYRGEAYRITDSIRTAQGAAEDITYWTFELTVRRGRIDENGNLVRPTTSRARWAETGEDSEVLLLLTMGGGLQILDAIAGELEISVTEENTLALPVGECAIDVWRIDPGAEACVTIGNLNVEPAVRE